MTHARIPDFASPLPSRTLVARVLPADPIHAAIERHHAAVEGYRLAPSLITNDECDAALDALVLTTCTTRGGAAALLVHLQAFLEDEAEFADGWWPSFQMAQARAADLALLLGADAPPVPIPPAFPSGRLPATPVLHLPPAQPTPLHLRVIRGMGAAAELVSAVAIVGGGCVLTGLASLL